MTCGYARCAAELGDGDAFCANCGTPTGLPADDPCDHEFGLDGPFCVRCGFDGDAPYGLQASARLAVGILGSLLAIGAMVWGLTAMASDARTTVWIGARTFPFVVIGLAIAVKLLIPRRVERARD